MKRSSLLRRFAAWLLKIGHRLSPPTLQDWGEAMLSELEFVEGNWPALAWAAGGATVLMRRSLIHFITGKGKSAATAGGPADRDLIPGGTSMRKTTFGFAILGLTCLTVLLFAPSFRQAVSVSGDSLLWGFHLPLYSERNLKDLAEKARAEGDAQTLAFVALESGNPQLADEAVKLDPKLTWIYYPLAYYRAMKETESPRAEEWTRKLAAWDPDNAVPHLFQARMEAKRISHGNILAVGPSQYRNDELWTSAMEAGFKAPRYDSYLAAELDLVRAVMARRHLTNPLIVLRAYSSHPVPYLPMLESYAFLVYSHAAELEKKGDVEGASREFWSVAHFGQRMRLAAGNDFERQFGAVLQREALGKLEPLAASAGRSDERQFLASQIRSLSPPNTEFSDAGMWISVYSWNARAGQLSLVLLSLSVILLFLWAAYFAARRITAQFANSKHENLIHASGLAGGIGLLISSIVIYISYHPFAELFSQFAQGRGLANVDWFRTYWSYAELPVGVNSLLVPAFWWFALLGVAVCLLVIEIYRFFSSRGPAQETV